MNSVPTMQWVAVAVTAIYGLTALTGGIIGYVKASSTPSLIAGVVSGILLLLCAAFATRRGYWPLVVALIIALALVVRFGVVAFQKREQFSEFLSSGAGITALVMITGGVIAIVTAAVAMASDWPSPTQP